MLRTLIVLPDGTELCSGVGAKNAIQSITVTECVNDSQELALGSTCANMVEAKLITPEGGLSIAAGDEITVYKIDDAGTRHKVGLFTTEKPTRPSANSMSITAYDRVSWLDKDLTLWLFQLDAWPYTLDSFARMVCEACGLVLSNLEITNGAYLVRQFSADGITGRQLMQWVGQISGSFCRATVDGEIELAWYKPLTTHTIGASAYAGHSDDGNGNISINSAFFSASDDGQGNVTIDSDLVTVTDDGAGNVVLSLAERLFFYQSGLTFEDYTVAPIEKVQLRQNEEDVGTVYPADLLDAVNTYIITGNYLLTASTADDLQPVAQTLYERLKDVTYTPCKVSLPSSLHIHAGHTVQISDRNGKVMTAYVMTKTQSGQRDTLECTGSPRRDSSTAINNQTYKAFVGKVLNLRTDVEGLKVENADTTGKVASLTLDVDNIRSSVTEQSARMEGVHIALTELEQSAIRISATVKSIQDNGVSKVTNEFGLTINESAIEIHRNTSAMTNRLNEKGMYVVRNAGTEREVTMLQADADGVIATDVTVNNYLIIGTHARFEDYTDGTDSKRTACFYLGGS